MLIFSGKTRSAAVVSQCLANRQTLDASPVETASERVKRRARMPSTRCAIACERRARRAPRIDSRRVACRATRSDMNVVRVALAINPKHEWLALRPRSARDENAPRTKNFRQFMLHSCANHVQLIHRVLCQGRFNWLRPRRAQRIHGIKSESSQV